MAFIVNGVNIPTNDNYVNVNGVNVSRIICNGVLVWERVLFTAQSYEYTGGVQEFIVPTDGIYKLEVWGAQGGTCPHGIGGDISGGTGGYGGYSQAYTTLHAGEKLYICCGGAGGYYYTRHTDFGTIFPGGYNGGGGGVGVDGCGEIMTGGGATHITKNINRGELRNYDAYRSEILIVAGGGGGGGFIEGEPDDIYGGSGGGENGGNACGSGPIIEYGENDAGGGLGAGQVPTKILPLWVNEDTELEGYNNDYFGLGFHGAACGGGGWYGGGPCTPLDGTSDGEGSFISGGGGGSGYVGGCPAFTVNGVTYSASMTNGVNTGNGHAMITLLHT